MDTYVMTIVNSVHLLFEARREILQADVEKGKYRFSLLLFRVLVKYAFILVKRCEKWSNRDELTSGQKPLIKTNLVFICRGSTARSEVFDKRTSAAITENIKKEKGRQVPTWCTFHSNRYTKAPIRFPIDPRSRTCL